MYFWQWQRSWRQQLMGNGTEEKHYRTAPTRKLCVSITFSMQYTKRRGPWNAPQSHACDVHHQTHFEHIAVTSICILIPNLPSWKTCPYQYCLRHHKSSTVNMHESYSPSTRLKSPPGLALMGTGSGECTIGFDGGFRAAIHDVTRGFRAALHYVTGGASW